MMTIQDWMRCAGKISVMFYLLFSVANTYGQAPANDNCSGAIEINIDAPYITGSVANATGGPSESCAGNVGAVAGSPNDEVWYKFTATKPYLVIAALGSAKFDAVIQVFSGTCGNLTVMDCANEGKVGRVEKLPLNHYVPGNTYYFRVYDVGGGTPATTDFQVKVYTPTPPSNDECVNAKPVQVRSQCRYTTENQEGATGSPEPNTCAGGAAKNDDIWYSFVPNTKNVVITVHASHNYRAVLEVFDKCGGTAIGCTTSTKHNMFIKLAFNNLKPGQTYYFRVYNYYTPLSKSQTFELCVYDPQVPANDECAGAITLNTSTTLKGSLDGATASNGFTVPCSGYADDDVWYTFKAVSADETLELIPSPYFDGVMQVFDGCNGNVVACVNAGARNKKESLNLTGLKPGKDYLVRVFSAENVTSVTSSFSIARTTKAVPLANDDCQQALNIPIANGKQTITGTLNNSTQSLAPCNDSNEANDAWFKFNVNSDAAIVSVKPQDSINVVFSVMEGCSATSEECIDERLEGEIEEWDGNNLLQSQTYFIRVYDANGSNHNGSFTIDIEEEQTVQSITNSQDNDMKIYPIPVQDVLSIDFKDAKSRNLILSDMQGNILLTDSGMLKKSYDVSNLSSGVYLLKIVTDEKVYAIKVVKK